MGFRFNASNLFDNVKQFGIKGELAVLMYGHTAAKKLEGYAKTGAKWTDRTGAARNRLKGTSKRYPGKIKIELSHGVDYGIWLELANEKRYAIIQPTIDLRSVEVFEGLNRLFERMGNVTTSAEEQVEIN